MLTKGKWLQLALESLLFDKKDLWDAKGVCQSRAPIKSRQGWSGIHWALYMAGVQFVHQNDTQPKQTENMAGSFRGRHFQPYLLCCLDPSICPSFSQNSRGSEHCLCCQCWRQESAAACHESADREKRLRGEEQSRCINSGLASGKQGPLLPSWRGAESWNKFEPGSGIHTKFITRSGLSLF